MPASRQPTTTTASPNTSDRNRRLSPNFVSLNPLSRLRLTKFEMGRGLTTPTAIP
jgi:hypothetical protein